MSHPFVIVFDTPDGLATNGRHVVSVLTERYDGSLVCQVWRQGSYDDGSPFVRPDVLSRTVVRWEGSLYNRRALPFEPDLDPIQVLEVERDARKSDGSRRKIGAMSP